MPNVYYHPEDSGLSIFESYDNAGSYEFNTFLILKENATNKLYYASDSGCSCPTPFEDYNGIGDLSPITKDTIYNFEQALDNHYNIQEDEARGIKYRVKEHMRTTNQL